MKKDRTKKIFCISLGTACAILLIIICALLFSLTNISVEVGMALGILLLTLFLSIYILPVVGVIFIILLIMYIIKMVKYKGKKKKMVIKIITALVLTTITLLSTFYTCLKYSLTSTYEIKINTSIGNMSPGVVKSHLLEELENEEIYVKKIIIRAAIIGSNEIIYYTEDGENKKEENILSDTEYGYLKDKAKDITNLTIYLYRILGIITIALLIFLYREWKKQFKFITDEVEKQIIQGNNEIEKEQKSNKTKKIIIATIIGTICIISIVLIIIFCNSDDSDLTNNVENDEIKESNTIENDQEGIWSKEYYINGKDGFRVYLDSLWRDRYQVTLYKTEDKGENWEQIETDLDEVYIGSEFEFINEQIGFVHDPYGGIDSYDTVKITRDGGKSWKEISVNKPSTIKEKNLFYKNLPKMVGGKLEIIAYTVNPAGSEKYKYYKFESDDLGKTWNYVDKVDYEEIN